jgi:hypothetical protein
VFVPISPTTRIFCKQAATVGLAAGGQPYQKKSAPNTPVFSFDEPMVNNSQAESVSTGSAVDPVGRVPTLAEAGIDKNLAKEGRRIGALSDQEFERAVEKARDSVGKVTKKVIGEAEAEAVRESRRQAISCDAALLHPFAPLRLTFQSMILDARGSP